MKKRVIIVIIILIIIFGGVFGWDALRNHLMKAYFKNFTPPPQIVSSVVATAETWSPVVEAIGTLQAVNGVNVTPEQAGMITALDVQSGQVVKAGTPLFEQDISLETQDLRNYEAQLVLAKANYQRDKNLYKRHFVSAQDLDQARATFEEDQANVAKTEALINQKIIKAPFDGKVGIRQVNLGQYVQPGTNDGLVYLEQLDPLRLLFTVPQNLVSKLKMGYTVRFSVDAYPGQQFQGTITAFDSTVDENSRNLLVQAEVPNPDLKLLPGMFASLQVVLPQKQNVVTIPQTAISYSLFGDTVFVIQHTTTNGKPAATILEQPVTVGPARGGQVAVLQGLSAGDEVVSSGQLKLSNHQSVVVNNSVPLTAEPTVSKANEIH